MKKAPKNNGSLPLPCMIPASDWKPPRISELPSLSRAKRIGFDTEFRDDTLRLLGCGARRGAQICGFSFALDGDTRGYYVPVRHLGGDNVEDPQQALGWLRHELWNFRGEIVGANITGDLDILETTEHIRPNYNQATIRDVQIADALICELYFKYNLDVIFERWGIPKKDEHLLIEALLSYGAPAESPKKIIYALPARLVGPYGEYDAFGLLPLMARLDQELKSQNMQKIWDIESKLLPVLLKIRQRGVAIDVPKLDYIEKWSIAEEEKVLSAIYQTQGVRLALNQCWKAKSVANVLESAGIRVGTTENGQPSITTEFLNSLTHPIGKQIRRIRQVNKLRTTFVESIRRYMTAGNRIHGTMRQIVGASEKNEKTGAAYGRLSHCIAEGTLIEVVRDVAQFPKGIPVESIKPGDLAYSYDHNLKLCLRKVVWSGKTGTKKVLRIHWRGTGRHHSGYLDVTPEHRVRLTTGKYIEASLLKQGDYVMALSRGVGRKWGYARLYPTGANEIPREHRFVWEQTGHESAEHVHHINENRLDNRIANLKGLRATEHFAEHRSELFAEANRKKQGASLKKRWETDHDRLTADRLRGEESPNWLGLTREYLEKLLREHDGSVTNACRASGHDFNTFKKYLMAHGFDLAEMKRKKIELNLSRDYLEKILTEHDWSISNAASAHNHCFRAIRKECIRLGFDIEAIKQRAKEIRKARGNPHKDNNHEILSVEELPGTVDVFDLEVADTHNFIANEICVHNCHPNTAQQPSAAEFAKMWRSIYVPEPGCEWGVLDYASQEPRWTVHFADLLNCKGAASAAKAYNEDERIDPHAMTAKMTGLDRKYAKAVFLALCYGEGGAKLCRHQLKLPTRWKVTLRDSELTQYFQTEAEAVAWRKRQRGKARVLEVAGEEGQKILDQFNSRLPFVKEVSNLASKKAEDTGQIVILGGRVLHFPLSRDGSYDYTYKSLNRAVQGSAGIQNKLALTAIYDEMPDTFIQLSRHDDISGSFQNRREAKKAAQIMREVVKARVPWRVDIEMGPSDGEIYQLCAHKTCDQLAEKDDIGTYWCKGHMT